MKEEGPKVFKLAKTNSDVDYLKNNTFWASASDDTIFNKTQGIVF